ncbi:hypothetical protein A5791_08470 [Mycobacterium sp. 852002-51163_SCH5372311]|uniref:DUF7159 family protein n=1 Tax=Mycobacterium sp. 852002-51163_SCH5372311 TaxID=1834097 RepID=UPI0007FC07D5|nr:hypothetical protein [Mycobacterium sp. 852002-51163_SCH5372311]OBF80464.1 hypothetical protein A5791_08470 [Mycobacterium sp. 852002-51163_SCH5372311]
MDAVLGLSVTPTTIGWVLAEGHGADGTILDHRELTLQGGPGVRAVGTAEQVTEEVLRVNAAAAASDHRLRVIGVTWNDDASAQAALLLESLTDAGFDNVVPIRMLEAVETLAQAIAPVIGYEQTAVCILEQEWATVVMVDTHDGQTQTAVKNVHGGLDGLTSWLTGMFDRNAWRPAGVVVVGSGGGIDAFSWQLEKALPVPVFGQSMAQVTIARGAALAAAQSTEFTDEQLVDSVSVASDPVAAAPARSRRLSYTGAATALAAGAVTFVASLSLAVGLQLAPDHHAGTSGAVVRPSTPQVAEAVTPTVPPPPEGEPQASRPQRITAGQPATEPGAGDPNGRPPSLRVLDHIPGAYDAPTQRPPRP